MKIIEESSPSIVVPPMNRITVSILMNKMFVYSAMNKKANLLDPYSMLNPDTSSDSPSAKSKGARFVSARADINHIRANGNLMKATQENNCPSE